MVPARVNCEKPLSHLFLNLVLPPVKEDFVMTAAKILDLCLAHWFSFRKVFAFQSERSERFQNAESTHSRLKAIASKRVEKVVVPAVKELDLLPPAAVNTSNLPHLHEFREVLGVEPVVAMTANREKPLSYISQYRLAVYVSGLSEQQKAAVYKDLTDSAQCA